MEITVMQDQKKLLPKRELVVKIAFESGTPSRKELRTAIAHKIKAKEDLVIIKNIYSDYGSKDALVHASVYDNEDAMKALEQPKVIAKNTGAPANEEPKPAEKQES